jgi:hypothetical protein
MIGRSWVGIGCFTAHRQLSLLDPSRVGPVRWKGIPDEESVHTVIALGYPDENYQTLIGRKKVVPRYFEC